MGYSKRSSSQEYEKAIQDALESFKDGQFKSLQSAALHFGVAISTLNHRHYGRQTQIESHQPRQILSEESTLLQWIIQQASIGFPVTPALVRETAQEIINQHYDTTLKTDDIQPPIIGHEWLYRFLNRYPMLKGAYSRQIESSRYKTANDTANVTYGEARHMGKRDKGPNSGN
jgi:hypothetical protein